MIVLDTNIVSEMLRPRPEKRVAAWLGSLRRFEVFITAVTQAEVLYGVERLPEGRRKSLLANEVSDLLTHEFHGRVLPFDEGAAWIYAGIVASRVSLGRPISQSDAMIAAISRSQNAMVATRNTKDFEHCGVSLINPWAS